MFDELYLKNNRALDKGGAIHFEDLFDTVVSNSVFERNMVEGDGGQGGALSHSCPS